MTQKELVYDIKERLVSHTDDGIMSDRHIAFLFNLYRARMLRQLYSDRGKAFDESATQSLCLQMETVDRGLCGITVDCDVRRSKERLPSLLSLKGRSGILSAGPAVVGSKKFDRISESEANSCVADPYAGNSYFVTDGYVYVAGNTPAIKRLTCLRIEGIFDDPLELEKYTDCCECSAEADPCITEDTEYPCPAFLLPEISNAIVQDYMKSIAVAPNADVENDGEEAQVQQRTRGRG